MNLSPCHPWIALVLAVACGACADGRKSAGSVSGAWCDVGATTAAACAGDDVFYLELTQAGTTVTGSLCEGLGHDCVTVDNGSFFDNELTFDCTFTEGSVDATLTLAGDSRQLSGKLASTKCACDIPLTLHRLD